VRSLLAFALLVALALAWIAWPRSAPDAAPVQPQLTETASPETPRAAPRLAEVAMPQTRLEVPPTPAAPAPSDEAEPPAALHFFGLITDARTGAPIAGARIASRYAVREDMTLVAKWVAATSDTDGRFELDAPQNSIPTPLVALADGHGLIGFHTDREHADEQHALELVMSAAARLELRMEGAPLGPEDRVVLEADGYALHQPDDDFENMTGFFGWHPAWPVAMDAAGRGSLELPAGVPLRLQLHAGPQVLRYVDELRLEPGELREITWRIEQGVRIEGHLVDNYGEPIPDAEIWLQPDARGVAPRYLQSHERSNLDASVRTDPEGRFAFPKVPPGWVTIGPGPDGYDAPEAPATDYSRAGIALEVQMGTGLQTVELQAWRGLTVTGRVLGPDGAPTSKAEIYASATDTHAELKGAVKPDGSFVLGPMIPGVHQLSVFSQDSAWIAPGASIAVNPGDTGIEIRLLEGGSAMGRVVDATTGEGVAAKILWAIAGDGPVMFGKTRADGSLHINGIERGTFDLTARTPDGRIGFLGGVEIELGKAVEDLRVELRPGGRLIVRSSASGFLRIYAESTLIVADGLGKDHETSFTVPPGQLTLRLKTGDGEPLERFVEANADADVHVDFDE
jgi:hypothetical protein